MKSLFLIGLVIFLKSATAQSDVNEKWSGYFQCLYTLTQLEYKYKQSDSPIGTGENILDENGKSSVAVIATKFGGDKKFIATPTKFIDFEKSNQGITSNQIQLKKDENGKYQTCSTERGEDNLSAGQVENMRLLLMKYVDDLDSDPDKKQHMISRLKAVPDEAANLRKCVSFLPKSVMWSKLNNMASQARPTSTEDLKPAPAHR